MSHNLRLRFYIHTLLITILILIKSARQYCTRQYNSPEGATLHKVCKPRRSRHAPAWKRCQTRNLFLRAAAARLYKVALSWHAANFPERGVGFCSGSSACLRPPVSCSTTVCIIAVIHLLRLAGTSCRRSSYADISSSLASSLTYTCQNMQTVAIRAMALPRLLLQSLWPLHCSTQNMLWMGSQYRYILCCLPSALQWCFVSLSPVYQRATNQVQVKRAGPRPPDIPQHNKPPAARVEHVPFGKGPRIYVGGVHECLTEARLREHFSKWGTVSDIYFPGARNQKRANYCFVTFDNRRNAERACSESGRNLDGWVRPSCWETHIHKMLHQRSAKSTRNTVI